MTILFLFMLRYQHLQLTKIKFGKDVPIEMQNGKEISELYFQNSNGLHKGKIYGKIKTYNPAFDITPSKYITKLITDKEYVKLIIVQ